MFLVFSTGRIHPRGGFNDLIGITNSIEDARTLVSANGWEWHQVVHINQDGTWDEVS